MWHAYKWKDRTAPDDWIMMEDSAMNHHIDGFSAISYRSKVRDDVLAVGICGAEGAEDFASCQALFENEIPAQYVAADEYLSDLIKFNPGCKVLVVGHSLGGALAKLCYLTMTEELPLIGVMTANSPGIGEIMERLNWPVESVQERAKRIKQWVVANDIIGTYGKHVGTTYLVPAVPMVHSVFDPHRAWDVLKTAHAREATPSFEVAWRDLLQKHPEAAFLLPLLKDGTLTVADLYAISVNGMTDTILAKIGFNQAAQMLGQFVAGLGSMLN